MGSAAAFGAAVFVSVFGAAAAGAPAPVRRALAVLAVDPPPGIDKATAELVESLLLNAFQDDGRLRVVGRQDVASILGLEKQRQAFGCDADAACIAEIAGALGVDLVAAPRLGRLGTTLVLSISVIEVRRASAVARGDRPASEADLYGAIRSLVKELCARIFPETGVALAAPSPTLPRKSPGEGERAEGASSAHSLPRALSGGEPASGQPVAVPDGRGGGRWAWLSFGLAAAAAGAGAWLTTSAIDAAGGMQTAATVSAADSARASAEGRALGASVSFGVAAAAVAAGAVLWWAGRERAPAP